MKEAFSNSPEFQRLLAGEEQPSLVQIALEIAGDAYPDLDRSLYLEKIDRLAQRVASRCGPAARPRKILGQINWALFVEEGFQGNRDDYFDPRNSYLNEVIDRKRGIPISLSVLYAGLAGRLGLRLEGANFPAHFMLRLDDGGKPLFIDPFHAGEFLDRRGCDLRLTQLTRREVKLSDDQLAPCASREIVARMLRNLKAIYLRSGDYLSALQVQRRLARVAADDPAELRDLGMFCLHADHPGEAIDPLQRYLELQADAEDADNVRSLVDAARRLIAQWN